MESIRITGERRPEMLRNWVEKGPELDGFTKAEKKKITELIKTFTG